MSFEETVCIIYFNAFNFFKIYREMNQYTKQKQTHKHRKQTYAYQKGGEGRGTN